MKNNEELKENREKYKFGEFEGITLISLVITIIVLIILAGVAIYLSLGKNGIFTRAKEAKETTNKQTATEIINLKITTAQMNKYAEEQRMPTLKELSEALIDDEIEYVTEQSRKQASTEYNVPSENPSSIFTKLNKYPYEFEINGQLQLASIDGVKIATNQKTNSSSEVLLETTYISLGQEIELKSNIYDYDFIKVFSAYSTTNSENNFIWSSQEICSKDIGVGLKDEFGNVKMGIIVPIMAGPADYRMPLYIFSSPTKIKLYEENRAGWLGNKSSNCKIKVIGVNY